MNDITVTCTIDEAVSFAVVVNAMEKVGALEGIIGEVGWRWWVQYAKLCTKLGSAVADEQGDWKNQTKLNLGSLTAVLDQLEAEL